MSAGHSLSSGRTLSAVAELSLPLSAFEQSQDLYRNIYSHNAPRMGLLHHLANLAIQHKFARASLRAAIVNRELQHPTGIPTAVPCALPHTDPMHVLRSGLGLVVLPEPVEFFEMGSSTKVVAAQIVILILVQNSLDQVDALQPILRAVADPDTIVPLKAAESAQELAATFNSLMEGK